MASNGKFKWIRPIVLLAALACAGNWAASQVRSKRDKSEVAKMTENMKTVCVGRYLIDVPAQAELSWSGETVAGFDVRTIKESAEAFYKRVAEREAEIAARGPAIDGTGGLVEAHDLEIPRMAGRTLVYGLNRGYFTKGDQRVDDEFVSVETHAHMDGWSGENEIPSVSGVCIRHAVFAEPLPVRMAELSGLHIDLPNHPDLRTVFLSMPGGGTDPGLLARSADTDASEALTESLRVTKLRADRRDIGGLVGEELLERFRELNLTTTFAFMWETQGVNEDPTRPGLSLELQAGISPEPGGKPVGSSLHEDAVLVLWDTIASSIRLRPSEPAARPSGQAAAKLADASQMQ